jgi:hypothetical protein
MRDERQEFSRIAIGRLDGRFLRANAARSQKVDERFEDVVENLRGFSSLR